MKHPEPYWRSQRDSWCLQLGKKQITLAKGRGNEAEAWRNYHRIMAARGFAVPREELSVGSAVDRFLDEVRAAVAAGTWQQYQIKLSGLAAAHGVLPLVRLTAPLVAEWVKAHPWSPSTKRGAITAVKVWLNWCVRQGLLDASPVKDMKRPKMGRRERTIAPAERAVIRAEFPDGFGDFLDALTWTGARPGEVMRLEARHVDFDGAYAALPGKTSAATGELIEFPLIPPMLALCRRLAERHPAGPLFRNRDGNPWTVNAVRCRMARLRARVKRAGGDADLTGVTAYSFRHSFATDALERGVPVTDVAALLNHRDIRTTMNYNHLGERREHLKRQAGKATGGSTPGA